MIYYLLIVLIIFFLIVIAIDKDVFSPSAMICESYILAVFCASLNIKKWGIDLSSSTFYMIVLGILAFIIPSIITGHFTLKNKKREKKVNNTKKFKLNRQTYIVLIFFQMITLILYFYYVKKTVGSISSLFDMMQTYREGVAYGNLESQIPTFVNQMFKISQIVAFISFYYLIYCKFILKENNKYKLLNILSILLFLVLSLFSGGRYKMVAFILGCIALCYFLLNTTKKIKINIKFVTKISIVVLAIMLIFSNTRTLVGRTNTSGFTDYISSYFGGSIELLDLYIENPIQKSSIWGKETFYGINKTLSKFGVVEKYSGNLEFRKSNGIYIGNVYTSFRIYHYDFGYIGIVILQMILAIFWTLWYKKIKNDENNKSLNMNIYFYSMFVSCLWLSSYTDSFFSSIVSSSTITLIIYYLIIQKILIINENNK